MIPKNHLRSLPGFLLAAGLLTCTSPLAAKAQSVPIPPGSRVRLHIAAPSAHWIMGELLSAGGDTLHMVPDDSEERLAVPATTATELQISRGRGSRADRGAIVGGAILGGASLAMGIAMASDSFYDTDPTNVVMGTILSASIGAGIGALIGSAFKYDKWEALPAPWLTSPVNAGIPAPGLQICRRW